MADRDPRGDHLHNDDHPKTIAFLTVLLGRCCSVTGWSLTEHGAWVNWDELLTSYLSTTEKAAVHLARGFAVLERQGGLPPHLAGIATQTFEAVR